MEMNQLSIQCLLRTTSFLVVHLLLLHCCGGQSRLIGSPQPVVANVGDNVILPCYLEPAVDVAAKTLEWTRSDLNPRFVLVWRADQDLVNVKNPTYKGRTSLFTDELKHGNISLRLSNVKPADESRYKCYIPDTKEQSLVELVVGAVSSPVIRLAGNDRDKGVVFLECKSTGWHPEPEVLWLDAEGNLLSAGPTETVRGPDDLYTVSSRVTVEKRHSNSFTCRVQQRNINQTRETQIHVPDDFFNIQSSSTPAIVALAVSLAVCIVSILLLLFFIWKKQLIMKSKRVHWDKADNEEIKLSSTNNVSERKMPLIDETTQKKNLNKRKVETNIKYLKKRFEQEQQREEAEKSVKTLKEDLELKKTEVERKQAELQQLEEEVQNNTDELQVLQNNLDTKNKELERIRALSWYYRTLWGPSKEEQRETENEVEELQVELKTKEEEFEDKSKEFEDKTAELQKLHSDIQMMETKLQEFETSNKEFENKLAKVQQQLQDEKKKREEAEKELKKQKTKLQLKDKEYDDKLLNVQQELRDEKRKREEAEKELEVKNKEFKFEIQKLQDENNSIQKELDNKIDEIETLKNSPEPQRQQQEDELMGGETPDELQGTHHVHI